MREFKSFTHKWHIHRMSSNRRFHRIPSVWLSPPSARESRQLLLPSSASRQSFKCLSIQAPHFPYFLLNLAILFHQTAIQTIGNGSFILRILQGIIEIFGLLLRHAIVIIACGSQNQIFTGSLVHPFGHHRGVENNGEHFLAQLFHSLSFGKRQCSCIHTLYSLPEEFGSKSRNELSLP